MGFEIVEKSPTALWEKYRSQFPVCENLIYLNHAAVAPLCRPAAEAMKNLAEDVLRFGALHYDEWLAAYEGVRSAAARLIHSDAREIAIVKNTSEGISTIATGLDWRPGDRIVAFEDEFPANVYPWRLLEQSGIAVEWLRSTAPLERVERACRGARLLSISFVQYLSGYRAPLQQIGEICRASDCIFVVDAIQGLGAFPLDVEQCHIGALASDGHKWMLGPEGCGILYVAQTVQDSIRPTEFGWSNVAKFNDYSSRDMRLRPDAGRYECGTLNTIGCFGLRAAIEFLLEVGAGEIAPVVQNLGDRVAAGVQAKGYELLGCRSADTGAGIVSFRKPGLESQEIVRRLRSRGIVAAERLGWIRVSPHFYVSPEEIDRMIAELP
jgi:cysteine desulfurase/selenocysteine lyase